METKPAYQSKTVWISLIMAIGAFFPVVQNFITGQPLIFAEIMSGVFLVLRFISKDKISIS